MFKNPAFIIKATWSDETIISDIFMTKKAVISEVKELLTETNEITKIEIEIVGIIE